MDLEQKIIQDIKHSMLSKNSIKLEVCRSIKSAIILAKSEKGFDGFTEEKEIEILQKLYKQRKEDLLNAEIEKYFGDNKTENSWIKII